jgi:hypothetical protein
VSKALATASVPFEKDDGHITITAYDGDIDTPMTYYEVWVVTKAGEDRAPNLRFRIDHAELRSLRTMLNAMIEV